MNRKTSSVACPSCGKNALWTPDNVWRPFCSERCKLIDLGAWATGRYRVPAVENTDTIDDATSAEPAAR